MSYNIDYLDASNRQETIGTYSLYYEIVSGASYPFEIGNLVIALLTYLVEEGRLNSYAMKVYDIKSFINQYCEGLDYIKEYDFNEIAEYLLSKLQGAKQNGEPIKFEYYDHEIRKVKSLKIAYIDYSLKEEGFKITDKGLEFLISSKEIPQEAKLTVSLYLFKLQLEKKKYKSALNTIRNINLETLRQLDVKNEILAMNRYSREEASRLYRKYWGDFFSLREEEKSHYEDAKERLQLYKEGEYLEKNKIELSPEDIDVLKAIDAELNKSSNLQSLYTKEIAKMSGEMLEIDKSSMVNVFLNLFNLEEHFDSLTSLDTHIDTFICSLQPLFLPKRTLRFNPVSALTTQRVIRQKQDFSAEEINIESSPYVTTEQIYDARMRNNYLKLFTTLVEYLTKVRPEIDNISTFLNYLERKKGEISVNSIDLLSFLLDLSSVPDGHINEGTGPGNVCVIRLDERNLENSEIETPQIEELLSRFWFKDMGMEYNAELHISTEPYRKVLIAGEKDRRIGNIVISLVEKGSVEYV